VEESVSWARSTPPTENEMLEFCDQLEAKLTVRQRQERAYGFDKLRRCISQAPRYGGLPASTKTWKTPGSRDIRIDLEVNVGIASVPDVSAN